MEKNNMQGMASKGISRLILLVVLSICGMYCYAQKPVGNVKIISTVRQQLVGHWYPDRHGWHGPLYFVLEGDTLKLYMHTEEGKKFFYNVEVNESDPSIEWSYNDDVKYGRWYIGTWEETGRKEILMNSDGVYGTSGVPTEIYETGLEATQMKCSWKYFAVIEGDKIVISYGSKSDYYSEKNKLLFTKIKKIKSAIKYFKD